MSVLPVGFGSSASGSTAYQIDNSLRFDGSDDYLSRTFGTPTTQNTFTFSAWVKRGKLSVLQNLFGVSTNTSIGFPAADTLAVTLAGSATITTTALYRDPSAWLHICYKQTTGAATLYANGVSVGTSATVSAVFNTAVSHQIGAANTTAYLDGYLSDIYFIDGQTLDPSYFGELNAEGVWVPKAYAGTYGNNGFHLDFADGTSTTTLGYDAAGSNDWTLSGMTRAAGTSECWMTDTPTNNYCVFSPIDKNVNVTLSNANLNYATSSAALVRSTAWMTSGKYYAEFTISSAVGAMAVGVAKSTATLNDNPGIGDANAWGYAGGTGNKWNGSGSAYGSSFTTNDVIGVAVDLTGGKIWWSKNGTWQASGDPAAGTNAAFTNLPTDGTPVSFAAGGNGGGSVGASFNAGQRDFSYTPPTGFLPLCTANLPSGSITTSGSFTGNTSTDGPFVWLNGNPTAMTINGNAVTFGTHADKTAGGFKVRSSSSSYNASGSNTYSITGSGELFNAPNTAQGNP